MADKANFNFSSFGPGSFVNMLYTAPTHPSRLSMNFMCGTDNVFHVNPRYDDRVLVMNSHIGGHWQHEEKPHHFPINYGQPTQLTVAAGDKAFDVFANKKEFCYSYKHRYDVTKVSNVVCDGGGTAIAVAAGKALPDFTVGKIVYIHGQAPVQGRFAMDFVPSLPHEYRPENIAMVLGVRLEENAVVRNTKTNEKWGSEERWGGMPFAPGQRFVVTVVAQKDGFEVGVNGSHFTHYKYRVPLTKDMSIQFRNVPHIEKVEYC